MEWFGGRLFFMRGWRKFVVKTGLHVNDILVFKLASDGFKMTLIRHRPPAAGLPLQALRLMTLISYDMLLSI
jgi:hypothetical protein